MRDSYFYSGILVVILLLGSLLNTELAHWPIYFFRVSVQHELSLKNPKK
jgi:hypothetical protein